MPQAFWRWRAEEELLDWCAIHGTLSIMREMPGHGYIARFVSADGAFDETARAPDPWVAAIRVTADHCPTFPKGGT